MKCDNKIIRTAIYIRVSTEEQVKHGYSLNSQTERLYEYCKANKYKVIDIYRDEGKSARSKLQQRKELLRLIEDAKLKKFDRIVFWRLDRWFRNIADYYKVQEILDANNIDWECSDEEYNTTTSNGRLHLNIKLSIAQNESDQTSDRIRFNFENMIKNRAVIFGSQCLPLGLKTAGEKKNKKIIIDELTKDIVYDMFDSIEITHSMRKTMIFINNKYNLNIHYDSIRKYFRNSLYYGCYHGIENYCEAYISKERWDNIQEIVKRNVKHNKKYDYIFSGLIKCPSCGNVLAGYMHTTIKKKYNKKYSYPYYKCVKAVTCKLCNYNKVVCENVLEKWLINNFILQLKSYIDEIEKIENIEDKKNQYLINTKKLEEKLERINELYIDGRLDKNKYEIEYQKISIEIEKINNIRKKVKDLSKQREIIKSNPFTIYSELTNESKSAFWKNYIDYITIDKSNNYKIVFK